MSVAVGEWGHVSGIIFCQNSKGMAIFGQHLEQNGVVVLSRMF